MTPQQANACWCPFAEVALSGNTIYDNRGGTSQTTTPAVNFNCIADQCMAWRWHLIDAAGNQISLAQATDGYCGMAGASQR